MGRKQETLLFAVDSKLPRGTGASKTLKKVGSLWRRLDIVEYLTYLRVGHGILGQAESRWHTAKP